MSVYVLAQIKIHDRERYDRYRARFAPVLDEYGGTLLAADEGPAVVEGQWPYDKVVLLSFPTREAFETWATSAAYQEISVDRVASTEGTVLLVRGLDSPGRRRRPRPRKGRDGRRARARWFRRRLSLAGEGHDG